MSNSNSCDRPGSSFKLTDINTQSVAGDTRLVGKNCVLYGDKKRPWFDGLRGKATKFDPETQLYTVRLDAPLALLETDSLEHEVTAEASRLLTFEEYEQLRKLEQESAELDEKRVKVNSQNLDRCAEVSTSRQGPDPLC